jgi:hypothetical protein
MLIFTYEDNVKIKNKHVAGISRTIYLSTETISSPPQACETIPLKVPELIKNSRKYTKQTAALH